MQKSDSVNLQKAIFTLIYPALSTSTATEARWSGRVFDVRNESHCNLGQKEEIWAEDKLLGGEYELVKQDLKHRHILRIWECGKL